MKPVLLPEDADYLVRAMTEECAAHDISYAARVGIAAVILNRVENDRYPDTAAAVLSTWEGPLFDTALTPAIPTDIREYRLCMDACKSAESGADPTGGALNFEILDPTLINDSPYYTLVIDNTAFW